MDTGGKGEEAYCSLIFLWPSGWGRGVEPAMPWRPQPRNPSGGGEGSQWELWAAWRWLLCNEVGHLPASAAALFHCLDFRLQGPGWPPRPAVLPDMHEAESPLLQAGGAMCTTTKDGRYYGGKIIMQCALLLNWRDRFLLLQLLVLALTPKIWLNCNIADTVDNNIDFFF